MLMAITWDSNYIRVPVVMKAREEAAVAVAAFTIRIATATVTTTNRTTIVMASIWLMVAASIWKIPTTQTKNILKQAAAAAAAALAARNIGK